MKFQHTIRGEQQLERSIELIRGWVATNGIPKSGLEIKMTPARRTNPQNAHYWGVVVPMVANHLTEKHQFPFTTDMAHDLLKSQFLPKSLHRTCPITGRLFYGSTTDLARSGDDESWQEYVTRIQEWAAKSGLYIPDPNEG